MAATGDWTANTPEVEFPAIQAIYRLYGAEDRVSMQQFDAPHNYNQDSREAVYGFFARYFLGIEDPRRVQEQPFVVEKTEDLRVFHGQEKPAHVLDAQGVVKALIARSKKQLQDLQPEDVSSLERFQRIMKPALQHATGTSWPEAEELYVRDLGLTRFDQFRFSPPWKSSTITGAPYAIQRLILGRQTQGERFPALLFLPGASRQRAPAVLVVHPEGKQALADLRRGRPGPVVADLLAQGCMVLAVDPFLTGEFHSPFGCTVREESVTHFTTYNQTETACRIQDILTALKYLGSREGVERVHLLGLEAAGPWCLLARALAPAVDRTALDLDRLEVEDDQVWAEKLFIPAIRRVGDVRSALALIAPGALLVHHAGTAFPAEWARQVYQAAGKKDRLHWSVRRLKWAEVLAWLVAGKETGSPPGSSR